MCVYVYLGVFLFGASDEGIDRRARRVATLPAGRLCPVADDLRSLGLVDSDVRVREHAASADGRTKHAGA